MHSPKIILMLSALLVAGCSGMPKPATVLTGECRVFEAPDFAPKGKTRKDQFWIDKTVESGIAACDWPRPGKSK